MNIGDFVPNLSGTDENGNEVKLGDFKGKKLALYFYPKDSTPGCTAEACSLRDNYEALKARGYEVLGVSTDSERSHRNFIAKQNLPFHLIADTEKEWVAAFGVRGEKKMCGRTYMGTFRTTFLIDETGTVTDIINKVNTKDSANQILDLKK